MQKLIVFIALLIWGLNAFCQNQTPSKDYYLHKSKNQRTTAWIMLGGGAGLFLTSLAIGWSDYVNGSNSSASSVLFWTGTAAMLGSIPFFISASKNHRIAASMSFMNNKIWAPQGGAIVGKMQRGITLRLNL